MYVVFILLIAAIMIINCYFTLSGKDNSKASSRLDTFILITSRIGGVLIAILIGLLLLSPFLPKKDVDIHSCIACGKSATMKIDGAYFCFKHYNAYLFDSW